ncbi:hypothetical protein DFH06DRAFT_1485488 [Mycena polygramma]|nr:hypothetical protein DFH06DRAFT_1485488 [Mycena polygramma]
MTATGERISSQEPSCSTSTLYLSSEGKDGVDDASISLLPSGNTARQTYFQRNYLRFSWLILHIGLVLLHLAILAIGIKGLERRVIFSVERQATVAFIVTALSTGTGMGYLSTALFVTQKLAMHYNLSARQTLTATHDNIAAWNGLGSALSMVYAQFKLPASVFGTSIVAVYLSCLALLHVTLPAVFSVVGFNSSVPVFVQTSGVPGFNTSVEASATGAFVDIAFQFFPWIDNLDTSQQIGFFNGSLYDTLQDVFPGRGHTTVTATGFNVTCGYLPGQSNGVDPRSGQWNISLGSPGTFEAEILVISSGPNIITTNFLDDPPNSSLILYTTNTVVDSQENQGSPVELNPAMNYSVTHLQFLECWKTLVPQEGIVDGESGQLEEATLRPSIFKTYSSWQQYSNASFPPSDSTLLGGDLWTDIPLVPVEPIIPLGNDTSAPAGGFLSVMDEYLMERLSLDPSWISTKTEPVSKPVLALHEIENAISALFATAFWLMGHVRPDPLEMRYSLRGDTNLGGELVPPALAAGNTTVAQHSLQIRLEISLIAVSLGLGVSILLVIVALPYAVAGSGTRSPVDSISILQTIWIFRRHDNLSHSLHQVADPNEANLRTAGLVTVQLVGPSSETGVDDSTSDFHSRSKLLDPGSPSRSRLSSQRYKIICISLHVGLIIIHLTLITIVVSSHAEHAVIFPVQSQHNVSLWITLISTAIGTVYLAATLYVTQTLALRKCLGRSQTLTATHDQTVSWAGIGAACSSLLAQLALPADIIGTLSITGYLATVLILHLSTPALFAVETFNQTFPGIVSTQGFPLWNSSNTDASSVFPPDLGDFLPWMGTLVEQSKTLGLYNGSLYDVLNSSSSATTPATVSATGFNVTCGYLTNVSIVPSDLTQSSLAWNITLPDGFTFQPSSSGPNILTTQALLLGSAAEPASGSWPSMILYTTNKVMDSAGDAGLPIELHPPMGPNSTVSELQILQCSRSLITQDAEVDPYSRLIIPSSLKPALHKTSSKWTPYEQLSPNTTNSNLTSVINSEWPIPLARSSVPMSVASDDDRTLAWMDLYLMETLGLDPSWIQSGSVTSLPPALYIHDIENALSSLLASHFWIVGHIHLRPLMVKYGFDENGDNPDKRDTPVLAASSTTVKRIQPATRLNLNVVAVSIGLGASILCFLLSMHFIVADSVSGTNLTGMGFLQVIWLFGNHPWLAEELEQVAEPTDKALRAAGMIRVQLGIKEVEAIELRPR